VYQTIHKKPHIYTRHRNKLHTLSRNHIKLNTTTTIQLHYHTSQAATPSRAPTQTADFSEAEESTDSDENDDRLSWQAVSGRGKKRTGLRTIKVPKMKKNKPQKENNHPTQITITNKFEALRHVETEGNTKQERKDPAAPLIFCSRNHKPAATNSYN
jgi:hypothetical protein